MNVTNNTLITKKEAPTNSNSSNKTVSADTNPIKLTSSDETTKNQGDWFTKWINDKDKVCTDGKDDGKLSFKEGLTSFGKGLLGIVKSAVKHPFLTGAAILGGVALTVATGGAALPALVALGVTAGAGQIGYGTYKAVTAKTDAEAKQAFETIGNGTFAVATSALGAKAALTKASAAGVTSAENAGELNTVEAIGQCFKSTPEALKMSGTNIKGNVLTWTTGNVQANSNALRNGQVKLMSKANDAQSYRFNGNGTEAEILKNNPGVFKGTDGKYYVANKWNAEAPFAIDPSKEQMIMMYSSDDMAVCDGGIFKGSYVDTNSFKQSGTLSYQDPKALNYGEVVNVTKQAPGGFTQVPVGTKVQTLEGITTVGEGQVIAVDHAGNPYVTTMANVLKRNIPVDTTASKVGFENLTKAKEIFEASQTKAN